VVAPDVGGGFGTKGSLPQSVGKFAIKGSAKRTERATAPFRVADIGFNAILQRANQDLCSLLIGPQV
jgi:hypothetical protein